MAPPPRRFGELDYRWVATEDVWTYFTSFNVTQQQLDHEELHLSLSGVDTFADILVNNKRVARTQNLFREYYLPVKDVLQEGSNSLTIALSSPIKAAAEAKASYPYDLPAVTAPGGCHPQLLQAPCRMPLHTHIYPLGTHTPHINALIKLHATCSNMRTLGAICPHKHLMSCVHPPACTQPWPSLRGHPPTRCLTSACPQASSTRTTTCARLPQTTAGTGGQPSPLPASTATSHCWPPACPTCGGCW
jgi:hypothetical protein